MESPSEFGTEPPGSISRGVRVIYELSRHSEKYNIIFAVWRKCERNKQGGFVSGNEWKSTRHGYQI